MSDFDAPGRLAYDAYRDRQPAAPLVAWDRLSARQREAWRYAEMLVRDPASLFAGLIPGARRLTFTRDTAITAIEVSLLGPKGVVPTLHAKAGDVLACSPDGGEVYVQRGDVRAHEVVAHYVDDGRGVLRPVTS